MASHDSLMGTVNTFEVTSIEESAVLEDEGVDKVEVAEAAFNLCTSLRMGHLHSKVAFSLKVFPGGGGLFSFLFGVAGIAFEDESA